MTCRLDGSSVTPETLAVALKNTVECDVFFPLLVTNGLLWKPAVTPLNTVVALFFRTHRDPHVGFEDNPQFCLKARRQRWRSMGRLLAQWFFFVRERMLTIEECAKEMGKAGARLLQAALKLDEGESALEDLIDKQSKFRKSDETIPYKEVAVDSVMVFGEQRFFIPRIITSYPTEDQVVLLPFARAVSDMLHMLGSFEEPVLLPLHTAKGVISLEIYYGGGLNSGALGRLGDRFLNSANIVLAVAGDDSLVSFGAHAGPLGVARYLENDFSMFDQSEDMGPLVECLREWGPAAGLSEQVIDILIRMCSSGYTIKWKNVHIKGEAGVQMGTGIAFTSVWNSINNIAAYLHFFRRLAAHDGDRFELVKTAMKEMGLKAKPVMTEEFLDVTFLKGWWLTDDEMKTHWFSLPSLIVKLGKAFNDPERVTKRKGREAYRMYARAVVLSLGTFPVNYPILGCFVQRVLSLFAPDWQPNFPLVESWVRPVFDCAELSEIQYGQLIGKIERRYDLTDQDIDRVENLIGQIYDLPAFISDPAFLILRNVDYC